MTIQDQPQTNNPTVLNMLDQIMFAIDDQPLPDVIVALGEVLTQVINEGETVAARMALLTAFCECLSASIDCEAAGSA